MLRFSILRTMMLLATLLLSEIGQASSVAHEIDVEDPDITIAEPSDPPIIDGQIDDEAWVAARPLDDFLQAKPVPGAKPSRRTTVRMLSDGITLYVAIRAYEPDPQTIVARSFARDGLGNDDQVAVVLDVRNRSQTGFWFAVNPRGAIADGSITDGRRLHQEWDAQWKASARIDSQGWTAELSIPLRVLDVPPNAKGWRLNIERTVAASKPLHRSDEKGSVVDAV